MSKRNLLNTNNTVVTEYIVDTYKLASENNHRNFNESLCGTITYLRKPRVAVQIQSFEEEYLEFQIHI